MLETSESLNELIDVCLVNLISIYELDEW